MALMWRDRRLLPSLDDDITTYLPEFKIINPYQTQRGITFRQLASHMAGLPRNPPCKGLFSTGCNITDKQMYTNLATLELMYPPGLQPSYSNLGFGLLGRVLERMKGPTWELELREAILDPLNMTNSGNTFTPSAVSRLAVGYYPDGAVAGGDYACVCTHSMLQCAALRNTWFARHMTWSVTERKRSWPLPQGGAQIRWARQTRLDMQQQETAMLFLCCSPHQHQQLLADTTHTKLGMYAMYQTLKEAHSSR